MRSYRPRRGEALAMMTGWSPYCLLLLTVGLLANTAVGAPLAWEYAPYQVDVVVAVYPSTDREASLYRRVEVGVTRHCNAIAGATWLLNVQRSPAALNIDIATNQQAITSDQIKRSIPDGLVGDKLFLLGVQQNHGQFIVTCRELDLQTRIWGPLLQKNVTQIQRLPFEAALAVMRCFSPLVRIEQSRGRAATTRIRAAGLVQNQHCPSRVVCGDILRPVIRRKDRRGELLWDQLQVVEWTYLLVRDVDQNLASCDVHSASRNPLIGRSSARIERLAVKVRPRNQPTMLQLLSQDDPAGPLEGYQVFAKDPALPELAGQSQAESLGRTDWQGTIEIPPDPPGLRLLYVKNGDRLIARLPIVPGDAPRLSVRLPSDDQRLEAEAFVKGMESEVMDLVGRREILATRIRNQLKQQKFAEAQASLTELKSFKTRQDLRQMIAERQQMGLGSANEREQLRIDHLLIGTRELLNDHLSPDFIAKLEREVAQAMQAQGTPQ